MPYPDYLTEASLKRIAHVLAVQVPESPINVYRVLLRMHNLLHEGINADQLLGFLPKSRAEEEKDDVQNA